MRFTRFAGFVMFYKRAILSWWLIQITVKILKKNDVLFVFPKKGLYFRRVKFSSWGAYLLLHKRRVGSFIFASFIFRPTQKSHRLGYCLRRLAKRYLSSRGICRNGLSVWHMSRFRARSASPWPDLCRLMAKRSLCTRVFSCNVGVFCAKTCYGNAYFRARKLLFL